MVNLSLQQEWQKRVAEFQASGLSGAKWCQANDYKEHQLWYWVRKFRQAGTEKAEPTQWLRVETKESAGLQVRVGLAVVQVKNGFDPELLLEVVRTLSALC